MSVIVKGGGGKPEEEKTVTAGTSTKVVTPSDGKTIKKVTVNPTPSQSKTVSPSTSQQTVSPDSGKLLSQVIVKAMEDLTPEVTAQTPIIVQILSNLGFTADTASGTNKQKLQTNNANLAKIEDYLPHGAYVWKKLTAQNGDFVDFVVSDQSTAYPDGGTHDGYWYKKVVEGVDLLGIFGYTNIAIDKITFSSDTAFNDAIPISHSLGTYPKAALFIAKEVTGSDSKAYLDILDFRNGYYNSSYGGGYISFGNPCVRNADGNSAYGNYTDYQMRGFLQQNEIDLWTKQSSTCYFKAGVEYALITMA